MSATMENQTPAEAVTEAPITMPETINTVAEPISSKVIPQAAPSADVTLELKDRVTQLETTVSSQSELITRLQEDKEDLQAELDVQSNTLNALEKAGAFTSAAKNAVETELKVERKRREVAEETVDMLRGKLEDSRKAIGNMQVQQHKRSSSTLSPASASMATFGDGDLGGLGLGRPFALSVATATGGRKVTEGMNTSASEPVLPSSATLPPPITARSGLRELRLGTSSNFAATTSPTSPGGVISPSLDSSSHLASPARTPTRNQNRPRSYNRGGSPSQGAHMLGDHSSFTDRSEENVPGAKLRGMVGRPRSHRETSSNSGSAHEHDGDVGSAYLSSPDQHLPTHVSVGVSADALAELEAKEAAARTAAAEAASEAEELKMVVAGLKVKLYDSQEAREASERALRALREFMSNSQAADESDVPDASSIHSAGRNSIVGLKLPPLPTDIDTEEEEAMIAPPPPMRKMSSWRSPSFSMWKAQSGSASPVYPDLLRKGSTTPSITQSVTSASSAEPIISPPMSPPISASEKDLPETPSLQTGTLGSFVASWSKSISPAVPIASPDLYAPTTPYTGPAVKRAFSFFGSGTSRARSISLAATDVSTETKLEVNTVPEDEEGEQRERQKAAAEEAELDAALAKVSEAEAVEAEPATPRAPTMEATTLLKDAHPVEEEAAVSASPIALKQSFEEINVEVPVEAAEPSLLAKEESVPQLEAGLAF